MVVHVDAAGRVDNRLHRMTAATYRRLHTRVKTKLSK